MLFQWRWYYAWGVERARSTCSPWLLRYVDSLNLIPRTSLSASLEVSLGTLLFSWIVRLTGDRTTSTFSCLRSIAFLSTERRRHSSFVFGPPTRKMRLLAHGWRLCRTWADIFPQYKELRTEGFKWIPLSLFGTKRLIDVRAFLLLPLLAVSSYDIAVVWCSRQSYPVTETTSET